ncbi:hypothetical protein CONPUDRAFT_48846 [Coniophora puteana RWD-64-598 SS2]|uniref:Protein-S-isoprenylcysteine O-methyltransferase n=1 Tax=Coniophora puteana (strain RWD-64-598) TaxID=741705 RepID=A0A5M3MZV7_CONPW|nr:uncharacterized protein CONPUDRAFT_48846 [Coniophora puteana RWD-64-598 SS2]EIW84680.1 hypothetical protein CONPUDRAFT_48846 [Coniophora puteana RWD-64-598 SS2]
MAYVFLSGTRIHASLKKIADAQGGEIRKDSLPTSFLGRIVTPIHGLAFLLPQAAYLVGVPLSGFRQPDWMLRWALPSLNLTLGQKASVRLVASGMLVLVLHGFYKRIAKDLGDQWHTIGRRKNVKIVKHGVYSVVRHPMYTAVLIQQLLFGLMYWSYVPFATFGICSVAFAIKMPIEEDLIMQDASVADEYKVYKKEVPYRILPYLW